MIRLNKKTQVKLDKDRKVQRGIKELIKSMQEMLARFERREHRMLAPILSKRLRPDDQVWLHQYGIRGEKPFRVCWKYKKYIRLKHETRGSWGNSTIYCTYDQIRRVKRNGVIIYEASK